MSSTQRFIDKANIIHNNIYDYSKVKYQSVDTKVEIICKKHGSFLQSPRNHLYKRNGCNSCAVDKSKATNTKTTEQFVAEAKYKHGDTYGYSNVRYVNAVTPVKITCKRHGEFAQQPASHLRGYGCKKCAVRLTPDEFITKAESVHGGRYAYNDTHYVTGKETVNITCPDHGSFNQRAESHLVGTGCPICGSELKSFQSHGEQELSDIIRDSRIYIETNVRSLIYPKEIDIYIPSKRTAIEFNGLFWHSELGGKDKYYHLNKTLACEKKGIQLIHVFENEWLQSRDLVISRILSKLGKSKRIYARKCNIHRVSSSDAKLFLNQNHIQKFRPASIHIGLEYAGNLVAIMSFGQSRFNKHIQWELIRYCSKLDTVVVGGASKIFKFFVKHYNPISIISYSDKRWNVGNLYRQLGFGFSHTSNPNYYYFLQRGSSQQRLLSRQNFQKHKLEGKLEKFDSNITEWENMKNNGYNRIWDCGNDVFVWWYNR